MEKEKVIKELEAFINDLRNDDVFIIPKKVYEKYSDFCPKNMDTFVRLSGRYTFEMDIFDKRLKNKVL